MEILEIDSIWSATRTKVAKPSRPSLPPGPLDLEPYLDFLDEIEAFDVPKPKPADYTAAFEL